jgi:hypothetical protein
MPPMDFATFKSLVLAEIKLDKTFDLFKFAKEKLDIED